MFVTGDRKWLRGVRAGPQAQTESFGCDRADTGKVKSGLAGQPFKAGVFAPWNGEQQFIVLAALQSNLSGVESLCCGIGSTGR